MARNSTIDQARFKGMLDSLRQNDPEIEAIAAYSKFVVAYLLDQDGPNPGWRKANIEGPVYVVRRMQAPFYQLLVKNQFSTTDLQDTLHPDWELDCQKNYVFYKVEDATKRIRGLWFHDDKDRQDLEAQLGKFLEDIRRNPGGEPMVPQQPPPMPAVSQLAQQNPQLMMQGAPAGHRPQQGKGGAMVPAPASVTVTSQGLRTALHSLVDDENFLGMIMQKLAEQGGGNSKRPGV